MANPLDAIPEYLEAEVQNRIAAGGDGGTFVVDESEHELLLVDADFTQSLKQQYADACERCGEDAIKVYQLRRDSTGFQLVKYESAAGTTVEELWLKNIQ